MPRYRLLVDHYDGAALHKRHSIIDRLDDWIGPHHAVPKIENGRHTFAVDHDGYKSPQFVDVPLYEKLGDDDMNQVPTYAVDNPVDRKGDNILDRHTGPADTLYPHRLKEGDGKRDSELSAAELIEKYGTAADAAKALAAEKEELAEEEAELSASEQQLSLPPPDVAK